MTQDMSNGKLPIPDGDILIHAGDFTKRGHIQEVMGFRDFLGKDSPSL